MGPEFKASHILYFVQCVLAGYAMGQCDTDTVPWQIVQIIQRIIYFRDSADSTDNADNTENTEKDKTDYTERDSGANGRYVMDFHRERINF